MDYRPRTIGRRDFIKSLVATGAVVAIDPLAKADGAPANGGASSPNITEPGINFAKNAEALRPLLAGNQQYTLLSDTNHDNTVYSKLLASPDFLAEAAKSGIKHVCVEMDSSKDWIFRAISDGKIKQYTDIPRVPDQKLDSHDYFTIAALNAKKYGIEFHAVDSGSAASNISEVTQWPKAKDFDGNLDKLHATIQQAMKQPGFKEEYKQRVEAVNKRYNNVDNTNAIKAATHGERAIVFYGAGHHLARQGQAQLLGNSKTVQLFQDQKAMDWFYQTASDPLVAKAFPVDFSTPANTALVMTDNKLVTPPADAVRKMQSLAAAFPAEGRAGKVAKKALPAP